jgi:hypothetical protein
MTLQEQIDAVKELRELHMQSQCVPDWNRSHKLLCDLESALEYRRDKADDYQAKLERHITKMTEQAVTYKAEIARLEACLTDGDYYPCESCQGVWSLDDLATVNGEKYCPRCVDEAKASDAYEAKADAAIDAEYRHGR